MVDGQILKKVIFSAYGDFFKFESSPFLAEGVCNSQAIERCINLIDIYKYLT